MYKDSAVSFKIYIVDSNRTQLCGLLFKFQYILCSIQKTNNFGTNTDVTQVMNELTTERKSNLVILVEHVVDKSLMYLLCSGRHSKTTYLPNR